jgi:hypothetical protein
LHPLSCTHPSLFGIEILVLANTSEIVARIASERADATSIVLSKCRRNGNIESPFERTQWEGPATFDRAKRSAPLIGTLADIRRGVNQPSSWPVVKISFREYRQRGTDGKRDSDDAVTLEVYP